MLKPWKSWDNMINYQHQLVSRISEPSTVSLLVWGGEYVLKRKKTKNRLAPGPEILASNFRGFTQFERLRVVRNFSKTEGGSDVLNDAKEGIANALTAMSPKTMKDKGFGHLKTKPFTIKPPLTNVGLGGPWCEFHVCHHQKAPQLMHYASSTATSNLRA